MSMSKENEYGWLDRLRIIAAFLIVAIHTYPFTTVNDALNFGFVNIFARIAVPFFLMTTGFFVLSKPQFPFRLIKKTGILYAAATLIYLPVSIYAGYYSDGKIPVTVLRNIFFDGTFYHLWYLPASVIGAVIVYMLRKKFSPGIVIGITTGLYIIGLLGDSYYGIIAGINIIRKAFDIWFHVSSYTRNGLFYAPVFLALGAFIADTENKKTMPVYITGFVISLMLMFTEGFLLREFNAQRHDSMYIMLLPCIYCLFMFAVCKKRKAAPFLRELSTWIYVLHPLVIAGLLPVSRITGLAGIFVDNSIVNYITVCLLSLIAAYIIAQIQRRLPQRHSSHK